MGNNRTATRVKDHIPRNYRLRRSMQETWRGVPEKVQLHLSLPSYLERATSTNCHEQVGRQVTVDMQSSLKQACQFSLRSSLNKRGQQLFFFLIAGVNCLAHLCLTPPPTPAGTAALSHAAAEKDTAVSIQRKLGKEGD